MAVVEQNMVQVEIPAVADSEGGIRFADDSETQVQWEAKLPENQT